MTSLDPGLSAVLSIGVLVLLVAGATVAGAWLAERAEFQMLVRLVVRQIQTPLSRHPRLHEVTLTAEQYLTTLCGLGPGPNVGTAQVDMVITGCWLSEGTEDMPVAKVEIGTFPMLYGRVQLGYHPLSRPRLVRRGCSIKLWREDAGTVALLGFELPVVNSGPAERAFRQALRLRPRGAS